MIETLVHVIIGAGFIAVAEQRTGRNRTLLTVLGVAVLLLTLVEKVPQ